MLSRWRKGGDQTAEEKNQNQSLNLGLILHLQVLDIKRKTIEVKVNKK
jgi:hypothetical protein